MGSGGRGAVLGWARREPKAEEAGLGRLGCTHRPPGDPDCYDLGLEPGNWAWELCLYSWVVYACLGGCGAEDVRDFFFFFF